MKLLLEVKTFAGKLCFVAKMQRLDIILCAQASEGFTWPDVGINFLCYVSPGKSFMGSVLICKHNKLTMVVCQMRNLMLRSLDNSELFLVI